MIKMTKNDQQRIKITKSDQNVQKGQNDQNDKKLPIMIKMTKKIKMTKNDQQSKGSNDQKMVKTRKTNLRCLDPDLL